MMDSLALDIRTPYLPDKNLGRAYNLSMRTVENWVLFHDDDIFLRTQPRWYQICIEAINQVGKHAGFLTCVTNRIGCAPQRCVDAPRGDDIQEHIDYANRRFEKYGYLVQEIPRWRPSGMFFITNRRVWEKAGGFPDGFLGVDNQYAERIKRAGFKVYLIEGLYVYHSYKREWRHIK